MGATTSTDGNIVTENSDSDKFLQKINAVASDYILSQNFVDMENLAKPDYCNNLVVLTAEVIGKFLKAKEVEYLPTTDAEKLNKPGLKKENIIYLNKQNFNKIPDEIKSQEKSKICIGIAKFYVKIANLFSSIIFTLNPQYTLTSDKDGKSRTYNLMEKNKISELKGVNMSGIKTVFDNICINRLEVLQNKENFNVAEGYVTINPSFCDMNLKQKLGSSSSYGSSRNISVKTLSDEPGIPELEKLYYDVYDYSTGTFKGMTDKTRKNIYEKDLQKFYTEFTGESSIPLDTNGQLTIKSFGQISLKDYSRVDGCQRPTVSRSAAGTTDNIKGQYLNKYTSNIKEKLFADYANNLKTMMRNIETNQKKLSEIIDKVFILENGKEVVRTDLTNEVLDTLIKDTRGIIVELYLTCEKNFEDGLSIFRSIVEKTVLDTAQEKITKMETQISNIEEQASIASDINEPSVEEVDEDDRQDASVNLPDQYPQFLPQVEVSAASAAAAAAAAPAPAAAAPAPAPALSQAPALSPAPAPAPASNIGAATPPAARSIGSSASEQASEQATEPPSTGAPSTGAPALSTAAALTIGSSA